MGASWLAGSWKIRSKQKAQVKKNNTTKKTSLDRDKEPVFLLFDGEFNDTVPCRSQADEEKEVSWGEDRASRTDPRIQLFFFPVSPRCLEKHKDFDIWAAQRGETRRGLTLNTFLRTTFVSTKERTTLLTHISFVFMNLWYKPFYTTLLLIAHNHLEAYVVPFTPLCLFNSFNTYFNLRHRF